MNKIVRLEPQDDSVSGLDFTPMASLEDKIIEAVKTVYDPEIPVNIYDLGLIYDIEVKGDTVSSDNVSSDTDTSEKANGDCTVHINMTLTAPACPVADILPGQVATVVRQIDGVSDVKVDLVFDPPWTMERMTEEAKLLLNML